MPSRESSPGSDAPEFGADAASLQALSAIELEFEAAEVEILKVTHKILAPLYKKRAEVVKNVPDFWPRAISAFPELDQVITQADAEILESNLVSIEFDRPDANEIRSYDITFTFKENEFFSNTVLKKSFVYKDLGGETHGIVSEPVKINWKAGKDVTNGASDVAYDFFTKTMKAIKEKGAEAATDPQPDWTTFIKDDHAHDHDHDDDDHDHDHPPPTRSFFNWFSWWGAAITFERVAALKGQKEANGEEIDIDVEVEDEDDDVYPEGEAVAEQIVKELIPNASTYYTQSIYSMGESADFDIEELDDDDEDEESEEEKPKVEEKSQKKRKAADTPEKPKGKKTKA